MTAAENIAAIRALLAWGEDYDFPGYPSHPSFGDALAALDALAIRLDKLRVVAGSAQDFNDSLAWAMANTIREVLGEDRL